jgi:hypothetical protein
VHEAALPAEEPLESEDRSDTTEGNLTARFTTALVTALFTALVTALFTALVTALFGERPNARKFPLARDTSANPTASDKTPKPIRHRRAPTESDDALNSESRERVLRGRRVSIWVSPFSDFREEYRKATILVHCALV